MKRFIILFLFIACQVQAQDTRFQVSYAPGEIYFSNSQLVGAGSRQIDRHIKLNATGIFPINHAWYFETGISYLKVDYTIFAAPGLSSPPAPHSLALVGLPVLARRNFGKYFYTYGGLLFDFEVQNNGGVGKQSGIGTQIGIGGKIDFKNGLGLFASPQMTFHRLLSQNKNARTQSLREAAVDLGIAYNF